MRRWVCLVLLVAPLAARPLGPSVTLEGEAIPLRMALERVGRQLNRRIDAQHAQDPRLALTARYALRGATMAEALAALEEAAGTRLTSHGGGRYWLPTTRQEPRQCLGRPLSEGWVAWFEELRLHFAASRGGTGRAGLSVSGGLMPTLSLSTPSDAECLRVVECTYPTLVLDDGPAIEPPPGQVLRQSNLNTGAVWVMTPWLPPVPRAARVLRSLRFDVTRRDLVECAFSFDLPPAPGGQLQSDGPVDLKLDGDLARGYTLEARLQGPVPDAELPAGRRVGCEAQLIGPDGTPWYTNAWPANSGAGDGLTKFGWSVRSGEPGPAVQPKRLEVKLYRPTGRREVLHVEFRDVPLPRLDD